MVLAAIAARGPVNPHAALFFAVFMLIVKAPDVIQCRITGSG